MSDKIDIVIPWVDGNDPAWQAEKGKYQPKDSNQSSSANRFRDWSLLPYWFRAIEKNMPWVNRIHFVTWGHTPKWLDTNHPKINIVKHEDFIPGEYLPTYNSNVIQYYLNRIPGITDRFIMFDDDQFILKPVTPNDFFDGIKLREEYGENLIYVPDRFDVYPHSLLNNLECINANYNKKAFYKRNLFKCLNPTFGLKNNLTTLAFLHRPTFVGFHSAHICQAYTKKHYDLFWQYCGDRLNEASKNRFRAETDFTTFLVRYIALMEGDFSPRSHGFGRRFELGKHNQEAYNVILKRKYHVVCLNDSDDALDFEKTKKELIGIFEQLYPEKSSYEK